MFAVIRNQGKQFRVSAGEVLEMPSMSGDVGAKVTFGEVLAVEKGDALSVGKPTVSGASVTATIMEHGRGKKILLWKHMRRKNYKKKQGHRQGFTRVRIDEIKA